MPTDAELPLRSRSLLVVGSGGRATAWADTARESAVLHVARVIDRPADLPAALSQLPDAVVACALPPRAALEAALILAGAARTAVVEAPLGLALADAVLPDGAGAVRVAHGWVTLWGLGVCERVVAAEPVRRVEISVAGLPEEPEGDPDEVLPHALALVRRLAKDARVVRVVRPDAARFEIAFEGAFPLELRTLTRGARLEVRVESLRRTVCWGFEDGVERVGVRSDVGPPRVHRRPAPPAEGRALRQLAGPPGAGVSLADARQVCSLTRSVLAALPHRLPPGRRAFALARRAAARHPADPLAPIGLRGRLPQAPPAPGLTPALGPEPLELWGFRAGVKPVVFLTVRPDEVDATLAPFGADVHVERRERRVLVADQDAWVDRRDAGQPRVELYVSRDPALAREAARLQAEHDPTAHLASLGALLGYPACCVAAFAAQDDRANNTRNRYQGAARTGGPGPWPWPLDNLAVMLLPYYPCRYECPAALSQARATLAALAVDHPELVVDLERALARPVLYFDHHRQIAFEGEVDADGTLGFRAVSTPPNPAPRFAAFAGAVATGDRLSFDESRLIVWGRDEVLFSLARTDPGLGFLAPFGR